MAENGIERGVVAAEGKDEPKKKKKTIEVKKAKYLISEHVNR